MAALGFAIGLGVRQRRVGSAAPPAASTITALTVLGAGALPDGADAASPNGWVARAVLPDDGASAFDPTRIVLTVEDPGFNSDGSATVRQRTIRGGAVIRRQQPNQAQRLNNANAGSREVHFSLTEEVFAGSTIIGAQAEAGYYGAAAAGSIAGFANNSTLAYPKPLFAWLNKQHERGTGTHFAVEAVAYHRFGRLGQMVACIEYETKDAQASPGSSGMVRASQPALSDMQTQGQRVEAWKGSIPLASLVQGDLCQVSATVKPWIGEAWSLDTHGIAWPTPQTQTKLRFVCDKGGGYGGAHVAVKAGAAGGAVQASYALALTTPFPTLKAALEAVPAWNLANKGHNDHSGATAWLMEGDGGVAVDHDIAANINAAHGLCWSEIRVDPATTAQVRVSVATLRVVSQMLNFRCPIVTSGSGALYSGSTAEHRMISTDGAMVTQGGSSDAFRQWGLSYHRNLTVAAWTSGGMGLSTQSTARHGLALLLGFVCTGLTFDTVIRGHAIIGCDTRRMTVGEIDLGVLPGNDPSDGMIIANNRMRDLRTAVSLANVQSYAGRGLAIVQNLFERAVAAANSCLSLGDGGPTLTQDNILLAHNSVPGADTTGRVNWLYATDTASVGVQKHGCARFNLFSEVNIKSDTFTTTSTASGRTGNWRKRYSVGDAGNVSIRGDSDNPVNDAPSADGGNSLGEFWPAGSSPVSGNVGFVDDKSGTSGAGGGDYRLSGAANDAYGRVPAGLAMLAFDQSGIARLNDGAGAAGAFERA